MRPAIRFVDTVVLNNQDIDALVAIDPPVSLWIVFEPVFNYEPMRVVA